MKIALISSGSGSRGGGEIYLRFLAQGLAAAGHEVVALVPDAPRMDELADSLTENASVHRFAFHTTYDRRLRGLGAWLDRRQQGQLATLFAGLDVDVLHVNQQVAEDGLDLVLAAAASGRAWVSTIHVGHSAAALGARFGAGRDWASARVLARAGGDYIAVSATSKAQLATRFPQARVHTVLNGVPTPDRAALAAARAQARADWDLKDHEIAVGAVGRIEAQKAPLALVDHLATVGPEHPVRLVWIGDGSLRTELENHARAHRDWMPLTIDGWRTDAALRLAGLDVFAMPSVFEGLPLALLEAMHAGLPVVATRADGIAEAVTPGESGFLCSGSEDWKAALTTLLENPDLRASMGQKAQARALAQFSTDAMATGTARIYQQAIERKVTT
ncbi:glycosyltransferase family 4 protein [uncultured Pelagimonas sp.]|uniref:glycosyltransferase family 4 protein n=1 Tax=uncultured Pelagimonas sp. TaxID=1618102 RepID=UPI0026228E26|nr:glycosyltransferase family 4 protein [uncultured Pelagimonas sp.]